MGTVPHQNLTGTDLHEPKDHKTRHAAGGADVITSLGAVTFSSFPSTPSSAPTTNYQISNKKYVDDSVLAENLWDRSNSTLTTYNANDNVRVDGVFYADASGIFKNISTESITASGNMESIGTIKATGGFIVPQGITPAPDIEGALFLDTNDGANGTLKIYSNSAWRNVAVL